MRIAKILPNEIKYMKGHQWKNHGSKHYADYAHGSFECGNWLIKLILKWLWESKGLRVTKDLV